MKITKSRSKKARWIITIETYEDEENLLHSFGCRNSLRKCNIPVVRTESFQRNFYDLMLDRKFRA